MSVHAFVDESQRVRYTICAAVISPNNLRTVRQGLRSMLLPRQSRLHFVNESPQRRRILLDAMRELPGGPGCTSRREGTHRSSEGH